MLSDMNVSFSGTTLACCVFSQIEKKLIVGNVGDSRLVIGRENEKGF